MSLAQACTESRAAPDPQSSGSDSGFSGETSAPFIDQRPESMAFEDVLVEYQRMNERLARVGAPLRLANAKLCPQIIRDPGFSTHRLDDYPEAIRPIAQALLGVSQTGLFVHAVRPGTSAADQQVTAGDQILAVNKNPISSEDLMQSYNKAVLRNGFDSVISKVRIRTPQGREYTARIRPDTACDIPAKIISSNHINGHTDGREILITSALLRSVPDDTNLALVIAHEMAHVIAGHEGLAQSQALELEADRMALVLMARAGYDIDSAVAYWESAVHPHDGGNATKSSHPTTQARYKNFRHELRRIKKIKSGETLGFQ